MATKPAPGDLRVVQDFVNTWDEGTEALTSPEALTAWLGERDLLDDARQAGEGDLRRALAVREAVRELLLRHNGDAGDVADPGAVLDAAAARAQLRAGFGAEGEARILAGAGGVDGALGRLLALIHAAQAQGTWERLKACGEDSCRWAFYDSTKNHSGRWCSMADCGNRAKARAYRQRHGGAA